MSDGDLRFTKDETNRKREWVGIVARDANRILFNDRYKALRKTDAVALANFLTEVEDTLKEKNT